MRKIYARRSGGQEVTPCSCEHCGHSFGGKPKGGHRVVCGDSTSAEAFEAAVGQRKPTVCLTDPPYGLGDSATIKNDYAGYLDAVDGLTALINKVLPVARAKTKAVVLTPGVKNHRLWPAPTWTMAWFVPAGTGRGPWGFCCWQPILCYGADPKLSKGKGSYPDAIVHTEASERNGHPCSKPVKFWAWLIERVSESGEVILDPFLGSGTGIISAEMTGRVVCGIELSPAYCDISVARWEAFSGKRAFHETSGEAFAR